MRMPKGAPWSWLQLRSKPIAVLINKQNSCATRWFWILRM